MARYDVDVLIVGGGPVGLTLANDLDMRHVDFQVVDAMPSVIDRAKSRGLLGRTIEQVDIAGLAEPIRAAAQFPRPGGAGNGSPHVRQYGVLIPQHDSEAVLQEELERRGHKIERNTRLVGFEQDADGVTAVLDTAVEGTLGMYRAFLSGYGEFNMPPEVGEGVTEQRTVRARYLVGCDGAHSTTRKALGLDMKGETLPNETVVSECEIVWTNAHDWNFSTPMPDRAGAAAAVYVPFSGLWQTMLMGSAAKGLSEKPTIEEYQAAWRRATGDPELILRNPKWLTRLKADNLRLPDHFVVGRVVLAGDAAHTRSATGGTGQSGGMIDAMSLGWRLALAVQGAAAPALLETYEEEQRAEAVRLEEKVKAQITARSSGQFRGFPGAASAMLQRARHAPAKPTPPTLKARVDGLKASVERKARLARLHIEATVDEKLEQWVPAYGESVGRSNSLMDLTRRGFSLTKDDRPESTPSLPRPVEAITDREARKAWLRAKGREWMIARHPAFKAHLVSEPVRAGDFCPDAPCRVAHVGTTLRRELRGPRANLWLFAGDDPTASTVEALRAVAAAAAPLDRYVRTLVVFPSEGWAERHGYDFESPAVMVDGTKEVRRVLEIDRPEIVYVRHDGYLGLRTHDLGVPTVLDYLTRIYDDALLRAER